METFYDIFSRLNGIPRPSHHEEKAADFLCSFAKEHGLKYRRDGLNCVVIEKPATPGYESAEPVVILNHMDMVCVASEGYQRDGRPYDPIQDEIRPYVEEVRNPDGTVSRWMKAEGTSLGADNGMGLSMALAVLADDSLVHPALEVLTTTNEEDGMSGAEGLSSDFIRGRKILNLDSEAYDEITVGAAGACLQVARWKVEQKDVPQGYLFRRISITGGKGGHSGVDINKGRCNCIVEMGKMLAGMVSDKVLVCTMSGGTSNAAIASCAEVVLAFPPESEKMFIDLIQETKTHLEKTYRETDEALCLGVEEAVGRSMYIANALRIVGCIEALAPYYGVLAMREDMPGTVMTSNNLGVLQLEGEELTLSCHTRSFSNEEMHRIANMIRLICRDFDADRMDMLMDTGSWMEKEDSPLLALTCKTFKDVLGIEPKKVAMHFVLEAAYYVAKYPGVEMASIGPLIIEPHSTSERVNLDTADAIWKVTVELLKRLAEQK